MLDADPAAGAAISTALRREGFLIAEASNIKRARLVLEKNRPDIIVVDVALEDNEGFDFIESVRAVDNIPIIVCTTLTADRYRLQGLAAGADDYIVKPFSPRELCLRVKTVFRRSRNAAALAPVEPSITFQDIEIEPDVREVRQGGLPLILTAKEFELLLFLVRSPNIIHSRGELLSKVWGIDNNPKRETTVTEHVRRLRSKLEANSDREYLDTVRGGGYRMIAPE